MEDVGMAGDPDSTTEFKTEDRYDEIYFTHTTIPGTISR